MITKLLHQIWNERKQNAWIFLEIIVASLFLWLALDPLYTLVCRKNIPSGCDISDVYKIELAKYTPQDTKFNLEHYIDDNSIKKSVTQAINIIRSLPEVEYYANANYDSHPNAYSSSGTSFTADNTDLTEKSFEEIKQMVTGGKIETVSLKYWKYYQSEGSDYPATFNIKNIHTGKYLKNDVSRFPNGVFVSEKAAMMLFGTTDAVGRTFKAVYNRKKHQVAGVFKDIAMVQYDEPHPLIIMDCRMDNDDYANTYNGASVFLHVRLKKGVDKEDFEKRFHEEIMPKLEIGNLYCSKITSLEQHRKKYARMFGISNTYRLYVGLSAFALFCAFLGLLSSFWIRTAERKNEIGIMRSFGASRQKIIAQFATEGMLLASIAFFVAMPFIAHYLHVEGFSDPLKTLTMMSKKENADPSYLHNQPLTHFAVVTAVSYMFIVFVTLIGAIVPAWRITSTIPADALRDE